MTKFLEQLAAAIVKGDDRLAASLARQTMAEKMDPFRVIQDGCAQGMQIIGDQFARLDCFLPEVMMAADAMNAAVEILKPHLLDQPDHEPQGTIVLATIQGDLHDLGKNIVKIMLRASGFTVYDLGADVSVRELIEKAEEVQADIIGASAILTTTMAHMPDIPSILTELGIRDKYLVMMGGAPVIAEWAFANGADGYGEDASEAVAVARALIEKKRGELSS